MPSPPSRTVHGDRDPQPVTVGEDVSGWCEIGLHLVEKALKTRQPAPAIAHISDCARCAEGSAS